MFSLEAVFPSSHWSPQMKSMQSGGRDESWVAQPLSLLPPSGTKITLQRLGLLHRAREAGNVCKYTNTQEVVEPQEVTVRTFRLEIGFWT